MLHNLTGRFTPLITWIETHPLQRRLLCMLGLWSITALLLFPTLGSPRAIVFDESYMIPRGQKYIHGVFFRDSHPPLGRLLIGLGQYIVHPEAKSDGYLDTDQITGNWSPTEDITGYRLFPAIFGTINPLLVFLLILVVTSSDGLALFGGFAAALDNALLTQSHFALSDSILLGFSLMFIICMSWLISRTGKPDRAEKIMWVLAGLAGGAAVMVKFTSLFGVLLVPIYLYRLFSLGYKRQMLSFLVFSSAAFLLVFVSVWQIHFGLLKNLPAGKDLKLSAPHQAMMDGSYKPNPVLGFWIEVSDSYVYMINYHENVPVLDLSKPTEIGSPWYQWPFGGRAMPYRWNITSQQVEFIYLIGNPFTWLLSLLGVIGATAILIAQLLYGFVPDTPRRFWIFSFALLYWSYMFAIMLIPRVLYLYHYLPPMVLGIVLFMLVFAELRTVSVKTKRIILLAVSVCLVAGFWFYSPFVYYQPLTRAQFQDRVILPTWDLRCAYCGTGK